MGLNGEDRPGYVKYNVHVSKDRAIAIEDVEKALQRLLFFYMQDI